MHWRTKAKIQNAISLLPSSASYSVYYWFQRYLGGLKRTSPLKRLAAGIDTWKRIQEQGLDPTNKVFLEVGTGQTPVVPLAYWLMGARRTITLDVNPYLKAELVRESLEWMAANRKMIGDLFGPLAQRSRLDELLGFSTDDFSLERFLDLCCIDYISPGDAASTGLRPRSIDFHTSYTVLEHIPPDVLSAILKEGTRIIRDDGLFVHLVDYTDHFAHSDESISAINFLQYSDAEWSKLAENRYMYMNRLRHDDVLALFQTAGHRILATDPAVNKQLAKIIEDGQLRLSERFVGKSPDVLSIWSCWIVSQKAVAEAGADYQTLSTSS